MCLVFRKVACVYGIYEVSPARFRVAPGIKQINISAVKCGLFIPPQWDKYRLPKWPGSGQVLLSSTLDNNLSFSELFGSWNCG